MDKLPKHGRGEQRIIKEFAPKDPDVARSAGHMIVRATNYGSSLDKFDELFAIMAADATRIEPPIALDREDVEVVHYGGERYKGTFGLEVPIPEGYAIPEEYMRISSVERTL